MLKDTELDSSFSVRKLAQESDGLSGSDLKELCRSAAMRPMREFIREAGDDHDMLARCQEEGFKLRPLTLEDFFQSDGTSALPPANPLDEVS